MFEKQNCILHMQNVQNLCSKYNTKKNATKKGKVKKENISSLYKNTLYILKISLKKN